MKTSSLFFSGILLALFLTACQSDDDVIDLPEDIQGNWSLVKKTGGFAGLDCTFPAEQITFDFSEEEVLVDNSFTDTTSACQLHLTSGTYSYDIIEQADLNYLVIDGEEWGLMQVMDGSVSIDGNQQSAGPGADFFSYVFEQE